MKIFRHHWITYILLFAELNCTVIIGEKDQLYEIEKTQIFIYIPSSWILMARKVDR